MLSNVHLIRKIKTQNGMESPVPVHDHERLMQPPINALTMSYKRLLIFFSEFSIILYAQRLVSAPCGVVSESKG